MFLKVLLIESSLVAVGKNPSVEAGDTGLIPGLGRFHMPWSS